MQSTKDCTRSAKACADLWLGLGATVPAVSLPMSNGNLTAGNFSGLVDAKYVIAMKVLGTRVSLFALGPSVRGLQMV